MGTPAAVVSRLNSAINAVLAAPEVRASLAKLGAEPLIASPEQFGALMSTEVQKWSDVVKVSGTRLNSERRVGKAKRAHFTR